MRQRLCGIEKVARVGPLTAISTLVKPYEKTYNSSYNQNQSQKIELFNVLPEGPAVVRIKIKEEK